MTFYDVAGKEVTYLSWIVEADTLAEAVAKAKEYGAEQAMIGDTELTEIQVCGEYAENV